MVYYGRLGKKVENFLNKISSIGCKWARLDAPRSETPVSQSLLESSLFPFSVPSSSFLPQFLSLQYKEMVYYGRLGKKVGTFWSKTTITGCKWASLNAPRSEISVSHLLLESSLFPFSAPASSLLHLSAVLRHGLLWEAG